MVVKTNSKSKKNLSKGDGANEISSRNKLFCWLLRSKFPQVQDLQVVYKKSDKTAAVGCINYFKKIKVKWLG